MRKLGTSTYFTGVDLEETTQVTQDNVKQKKFTLRAQVNYGGASAPPPAPAKPATPPGKTAAAAPAAPTMTASAGRVP